MRVDHIAVAVKSLEEALRLYRDTLGLRLEGVKVVEEEGVKVAFLSAGGVRLELMEPLGEDTPVGRFLAKRGEGLHHIALSVPNLDDVVARLVGRGVRLVGDPRAGDEGRYVFVHPKAAHGVLIELVERVGDVQEDTGGQ